MITIRLLRIGKKKQPSYKIVVTDKKNSPTGGRFVDEIGFYNPLTKEKSINGEKAKYWISKGASVSDTVHNLLVIEGVIAKEKRPKHNLPEKKEGETEGVKAVPEAVMKEPVSVPKADTPKEEDSVPETPIKEADTAKEEA